MWARPLPRNFTTVWPSLRRHGCDQRQLDRQKCDESSRLSRFVGTRDPGLAERPGGQDDVRSDGLGIISGRAMKPFFLFITDNYLDSLQVGVLLCQMGIRRHDRHVAQDRPNHARLGRDGAQEDNIGAATG
ncbi:hypothetical protein IF1G_09731 [Cordyceps javanica]|uniref:Uncharacterized protein n=1 Tax=Cordyceps javanica TaxID=43265 RepID=A0A545UQC3_9HYPO|nr:hypothetical protein IF1G_09731 [Cordyceps javanica]